jgi:WD40 repeat protein
MHSDGKVWIGDRDNLFRLIHSPKNDDENATAIAFHPDEPLIAVAVNAHVIVYKISPSLKPELHLKVSFYESGYFCPRPKFSADKLDWNPTGTFLTAISAGNLSMCFYLKPDTNEVIGGFNGGMKYAELSSFQKGDIPPSCACFSSDGKLAVTGYPNGTIMTKTVEKTADGFSLNCLKILENVSPGQIVKIVPHPHDPLVFAIEVEARWSQTSVLIVLVSHDGSVTITATIPDAKSPHFHKDWLLVLSRNKLMVHQINRSNIPCLVTEFHLRNSGTFSQDIGAFFVETTPNGEVILYYSLRCGGSKLHMAKISLE